MKRLHSAIYAVETANGRVKIGVTTALVTRVLALTTKTRGPVRLVAAFPATARTENDLHRKLNERLGRRWLRDRGAEWYARADVAAWLDALPAERRCDITVSYHGAAQKGRARLDLDVLRGCAAAMARPS